MQSRTDKYKNNFELVGESESLQASSRVSKNQKLYKEVSYAELDNFDLNSNVSVLGDNTSNIDITKIVDILDERYNETPRKKTLGDTNEMELPKINLDETREYDINSILAKAKESKEFDYEEDRLKKVNENAESILKDIDKEEYIENKVVIDKKNDEDELMDLINTITAKELIREEESMKTLVGEMDPLDLLTDLRGDDDTRVMGAIDAVKEYEAMHEEALRVDKEKNISIEEAYENEEEREKTQGIEEVDEDIDDTSELEEIDITNDFSELLKDSEENDTNKNSKKIKKDKKKKESLDDTDEFDDFSDLKESGISGIIVKILIFLIFIILIVGGVILANFVFDLGLF